MSRFAWQGLPAIATLWMLAACAAPGRPAAADAASVAWPDTRWRVVALADEDGRLAAVPAGMAVDLAFDTSAQRVSGSAGCNRYGATVTPDGAGIRFGAAAASKRMCDQPAGVMALEARFLRTLARVVEAVPEGDRVALRSADGVIVMDIVRAPAD